MLMSSNIVDFHPLMQHDQIIAIHLTPYKATQGE
jgi:hypothetical protein